ncbi:MAG TPA: IPT/TIG domain-containing protein [Nitrospira sp.]
MTPRMTSRQCMTCLSILVGAMLSWSVTDAKSSSPQTGKTVKAVCDYQAHPAITLIMPTHVKPGQRITINGKNFGSKACFHSVSFGPKSTDAWTYVNSTTVEATVPNLKPGSVPVTVSTEAGTAQYPLDVQAK